MHGSLWSLKANTVREAGGDGVQDKPHEAGVNFEGRYEACENGHHGGRDEHEGCIVAQRARSGSAKEHPNGAVDDDRNHHVAAFGRCVPTDDLIISGQVVLEYVHCAISAHGEDEAGDNARALQDAKREGSGIPSPLLAKEEGGEEDPKGDKEANDFGIVPGKLGAGPRKSNKETRQARDEE